MTRLAVVLIALGAAIGLTMAVQHFKGRTPPAPALAILHGVLAGSGVIVSCSTCGKPDSTALLGVAFLLFVAAALGGLYLVSHHMRQKPLPNGVIVIHGLVAVIAFLVLATAVFLVP